MSANRKSFIKIHIELTTPFHIGSVTGGYFKVIPIIGGVFTGEIDGKVLNFGADYNLKYDNNKSHVDACYILRTNDNEDIVIRNTGDIDKSLSNGSRTTPSFIVDKDSKYFNLLNQDFYGEIVFGCEEYVDIEIYVCN